MDLLLMAVLVAGIPLLLVGALFGMIVWAYRQESGAWRIPIVILGLIALLELPALLNILFNINFYMPKEGRVVEAATGKGMPNVAVIAAGNFFGGNVVHGTTRAALYRVITYTDADGNYRIPSQWHELVWWAIPIPGTTPELKWTVTVFQPGYIVDRDEPRMELYENEKIFGDPPSVAFSPPSAWHGFVTRVEPIRMLQPNVSLRQAVRYAQRIAWAGKEFVPIGAEKPEEIALQRLGNQYFEPRVCSLNPENTMGSVEASTLTDFGRSHRMLSFKELLRLEPHQDSDAMYHVKSVCEAMRAEG